MANTYSQLYVHTVFAVKGRACLIPRARKEDLYKYITGIVARRDQKMLAVNGISDHIPILVGMQPSIAVSDLVRDIKTGSSNFINEQKWIPGRFSWQEGFGAFSYSRNEIDRIIKYIQRQEQHHRKRSFKEEYVATLLEFAVEYDPRYLFEME